MNENVEQIPGIPSEPPLRPWSSWRARSKRSKAIFLSVAILLCGGAAYLLIGRGNDTSSNSATLMAVTLDGDELDHVQFGSKGSLEGLLAKSFRLRLDTIPEPISVLAEGEFRTERFLVVSNGRIALVGDSDDRQGLIVVDPGSGEELELIEYDDVSISATFVRRSSQFFVTVFEEDRSRCIGVDLEGNQVLIGRGYCQVLDSGDVLAIDEDDDSNEVSVLKADADGQQTGRYDFELEDFVVTSDGSFAYGYEREDDQSRRLLAVYDFREEQVWRQPEDAIYADVVSEMSSGLVIAVDGGDEVVSLELITSTEEGSDVSGVASAEEVSLFVVDSGETLVIGEAMAGKEIDQWRIVQPTGEEVFFEEAITSWFEVPASGRIVAFDGIKGEIYTGFIESGLEYVDDVDAEFISVYSSGTDLFVHASDTLFLLDVETNELFRLSNDVAQVDYVSAESGVLVYRDEDENNFLARFVDGELVDLDEDDNILAVVEADGKIYYSTSDYDGDNLTLKSIKLHDDRARQASEVDEEIADEVLVFRSEVLNTRVETSYVQLFEAIIDERRRECRDEGLETLEVSGTTTLQSIPGTGSVVCLTVSDADLEDSPFFGVEISNEADFDLAMMVEQDGDTLYEADDQTSDGRIVSYSPLRDDMFLEAGTYRLRVFPVEGGGVTAPTTVRFFATSTSSSEYSEIASGNSFSTSGCDYVLNSSESSVYVEVSYDFTSVLCIERLSTETIVGFETETVWDGEYLDVSYGCDDFFGSFYYTSSEWMPAGKGYNRCSFTETWPSDGSYGEIIVFYGGE